MLSRFSEMAFFSFDRMKMYFWLATYYTICYPLSIRRMSLLQQDFGLWEIVIDFPVAL